MLGTFKGRLVQPAQQGHRAKLAISVRRDRRERLAQPAHKATLEPWAPLVHRARLEKLALSDLLALRDRRAKLGKPV